MLSSFNSQVSEIDSPLLAGKQERVKPSPTDTHIPIQYLYRPEEQQIRLMMNLKAPFSNRITYGKDSTEGTIDILETYCYLKGLTMQRRLRFESEGQVYRVVRSGSRAVIFRKIIENANDTLVLLEILSDARLSGVTQLNVNHDADQRALLERSDLRGVYLITTSDFDTRSVWDAVDR